MLKWDKLPVRFQSPQKSEMKEKEKGSKRRRKDGNAVDPIGEGRIALQALRELVGYDVQLVDELKALFRSLDAGKSLDISGIPDEYVKSQVALIFRKCSLLRRKDKYTYQSRAKPGRGSVMALLEPVMDEPRAELELAYQEAQQRKRQKRMEIMVKLAAAAAAANQRPRQMRTRPDGRARRCRRQRSGCRPSR